MAFPMNPWPELDRLVEILCVHFGFSVKMSDCSVTGPAGPLVIRYFYREDHGRKFVAILPEPGLVPPSTVRSIIAQLGLNPSDVEKLLGWL